MGWEGLADLCLKATTQVLGVAATWTSVEGGAPVVFQGIFDDEFEEFEPETGARITVSKPNLAVRLADLTDQVQENDKVTVASQNYVVAALQEDGEGGALLILELEAAP